MGTHKCLFLDEAQACEDVGYVIEPAHLSWECQRMENEEEKEEVGDRLMKQEYLRRL